MEIPNRKVAQALLREAEALNPGPWVDHSIHVAQAAENIAANHPGLESESAYVFGLLHDIGRREGVYGMRHVVDGYHYMIGIGYPEVAQICLTHSYPIPNVMYGSSKWDGTPAELKFVAETLAKIHYTLYDQLIQLCDSLCLPNGPVLMEKRFVDVVMRYGFNEYTIDKWQAFFDIRDEFETVMGKPIYELFPGVIENTFRNDHD
jgi:hypothetical protein